MPNIPVPMVSSLRDAYGHRVPYGSCAHDLRIPIVENIAPLLVGTVFAVAVGIMSSVTLAQPATLGPAASPAIAIPQSAYAQRPKIGLVLSGGAARGLAHIGVLKVLEELRVPVDYISATSMGSFVGGLYATGMSAAALERLVSELDWRSFFSDQPPRGELTVRRKREDASYTIPLELGFRDLSLRLATGALSGQKLELLLHGLTLAQDNRESFDHLPIPFRAVATDMVDGTEVVFEHGPLHLAMRASLSVPGVFTPLELDGKVLGDGGLVKNLPVDIVQAMGADVVIAVNIGTPLLTREQLFSFVGIAEQSINILTAQNVRVQLARLTPRDILITPELGNLSIVDFQEGPHFIALGQTAARAVAGSLSRYSLPEDAYAAYRDSLRRPQTPAAPSLVFAGIRGTELANPEVLQAQVGLSPGAPVDFKTAQDKIATLYGRGDFERIDYRLTDERGQRGIAFVVSEKPWGPNFLKFGVGFSSDTQGENRFGLHARHKRFWLNSFGTEWNNELEVGTTASYTTELYQPLNLAQSLFGAGYGSIASGPQDLFDRGRKIAEYEVLTERAGADFGYVLGDWGELRIGPQISRQRARPRIAPAELGTTTMDEWGLSAAARVDTQDQAFFARRGLRLSASVFTGTRRVGGADYDVTHADLDVHQAIFVTDRGTLELGARLGATNRFDPTFASNPHLGGFLELSGLRNGQLQGTYVGRGRTVYRYRVGNLPVFGNAYYAGGSLEIGNVWSRRDAISFGDTVKAGSLFVVTDTPFGPFYVAWGHTSRGESAWYLLLGRP